MNEIYGEGIEISKQELTTKSFTQNTLVYQLHQVSDYFQNFDFKEFKSYHYDIVKYENPREGTYTEDPNIFVFCLSFEKKFSLKRKVKPEEETKTRKLGKQKVDFFKIYVAKEHKEKLISLLDQLKNNTYCLQIKYYRKKSKIPNQ